MHQTLFCDRSRGGCGREIREGIELPYEPIHAKAAPGHPAFLGTKIISALCQNCSEAKRKDPKAFKQALKSRVDLVAPEDHKARAKLSLKRLKVKAEPTPSPKAKSSLKQQPAGSQKANSPSVPAAVLGLFKKHPKKTYTTGGIFNALRDEGTRIPMSDLRPIIKKLLKKGELKKHGKEIGL